MGEWGHRVRTGPHRRGGERSGHARTETSALRTGGCVIVSGTIIEREGGEDGGREGEGRHPQTENTENDRTANGVGKRKIERKKERPSA